MLYLENFVGIHMITIVGTGAGGGLLARELAKNGIEVTIFEKGPYIDSKDAYNYYNQYQIVSFY